MTQHFSCPLHLLPHHHFLRRHHLSQPEPHTNYASTWTPSFVQSPDVFISLVCVPLRELRRCFLHIITETGHLSALDSSTITRRCLGWSWSTQWVKDCQTIPHPLQAPSFCHNAFLEHDIRDTFFWQSLTSNGIQFLLRLNSNTKINHWYSVNPTTIVISLKLEDTGYTLWSAIPLHSDVPAYPDAHLCTVLSVVALLNFWVWVVVVLDRYS